MFGCFGQRGVWEDEKRQQKNQLVLLDVELEVKILMHVLLRAKVELLIEMIDF